MSGPTRVAAYDCGTNSLRLLVADLDPDTGSATEIYRGMQIVRLGENVDRTGSLSPVALQRTLAAVDEFSQIAHERGAERVAVGPALDRDRGAGAELRAHGLRQDEEGPAGAPVRRRP